MSPTVAPPAPERRPDASMKLLNEILESPQDPAYDATATRREAAGLPRATSLRSPRVIAIAVVIGLLFGVAASTLTGGSTTKSRARAELISQIEKRKAVQSSRSKRAAALRAEVTAIDAEALAKVDARNAARLTELSGAAGALPARGPGFVVTLDDAAPPDPDSADGDPRTGSGDEDGRVLARDLQIITNSLWEAGAEAIAVNGQRLTALSSIRFAGDAILVDYRPLTRPYVVTAIGDPGTLPARFADGNGGTYLNTLKASFGISVLTKVVKEVTVPASPTLTIRAAVVPDATDTGSGPEAAGDRTGSPPGGSS